MDLFKFVKIAVNMRATQELGQMNRNSAGLNLLQSRNLGSNPKSTFQTSLPNPKPLLGPGGPMKAPDNNNFPYIMPKNKAGQRNISNPSPSVAVSMPIK